MPVPSRDALEAAERTNAERGNEIGGLVSSSHGFIPVRPPATSLPASHSAWDDVAAALPELYRGVKVRDALQSMPVLDARPESLPDEHLLRSLTLLSIFAHAWVRAEIVPAGAIPPPVLAPWTQATARIGRSEAFMQYNDLILTNWRLRDPSAAEPMVIENLDLLVPTVGNQTERVFYLTQVEMTARAAPLVSAVVRAQEAMAADDEHAVKGELLVMLDVLRSLVERSFVKIDPNPRSESHCDPVIWGTTVAPFAVSLAEHIPGPGGTASPMFHLMDAFLGRGEYGSQLGQESSNLQRVAPPLQQAFVDAVQQTSLRDYVARTRSRSLDGLVRTVAEAYAGDHGLIAAHRMKAYGFLEVAFKVGRSVTIGGFEGLFRDRPWKEVDAQLNVTRLERAAVAPPQGHTAELVGRSSPALDPSTASRVELDVSDRGVVYQPGDRCGVLPDNDPVLIDRTISALETDGDAMIPLTPEWVEALRDRSGFAGSTRLRVRDFLRFAKLRPVQRSTAKALYAASVSPRLGEVLDARAEDQLELWDLLALVASDGYDVTRLCESESWQAEALAAVVPPERFRMYSVSTAPDVDDDGLARHLDLTVGELVYESAGSTRHGTASSFLHRAEPSSELPIRVMHPRRFRLPDEPDRPIVMFAAGTGIAPFRGFIREHAGDAWLFVAARDRSQLLYASEIDERAAAGRLSVHVAMSAERRLEDVMLEDDNARLLRSLVDERDAVLYVCGRPGFAHTMLETLATVVGRETVRQLVADRRIMMDVFTAFAPAAAPQSRDAGIFDASEVVLHNDEDNGYWIVVDGMVYDVSDFVHLHPGGKKLIVESAGMDATRAKYRAVLHHESSEIDAMLSMYKIGSVRRLRFGGEWGIVLTPDGFEHLSLHDAYRFWVRFLYLVVEMENALGNDFSYMRMVTVRGEAADDLTPYKLMLFGNTHLRFFDHYFRGSLGDDLRELWMATIGMCAPDQPFRAMDDALADVVGTPDAATVARFGERLRAAYREAADRVGDEAYWQRMRQLCEVVEATDRGFLHAMKLALRDGVRVFERYEADTIRLGGAELVDILRQIPNLATDYHAELLARVREVDPSLL